jgi:hypothetical protein
MKVTAAVVGWGEALALEEIWASGKVSASRLV